MKRYIFRLFRSLIRRLKLTHISRQTKKTNEINSFFYFSVGCRHGPGYASPLDAMKNGPREKLLYIVAVQPDLEQSDGDYLATVDVDPTSSTYSKVIHRTYTKVKGNELHHSGWNTCSSCFEVNDQDVAIPKRDKLVCPAINSNRVYVFDMSQDERKPVLYREIDGSVMKAHNVSAPHTTHCMYDGTILISTMGDANDNAKGEFIQFDGQFNCLGTWTRGDKRPDCGYDFWYQPAFDVLVASEWGTFFCLIQSFPNVFNFF